MRDPRSSRAWRRLRDLVVEEEPLCWLKLEGCTGYSETGDHVLTVKARPDLALVRENVRGACHSCNDKRNATPVSDLDALRKNIPSAVARFFE